MRLHRRFLYSGLFLLALGGALVVADAGAVDTAALVDAVRLWPVAVIAIGAGLALRRSQVGLGTGMLAAAMPGLVLGAALGAVPRTVGTCGARADPAPSLTRQGTFDGPATVSVTTACGSLTIHPAADNQWRLQAGNTAGHEPAVQSTGRSLAVSPSEAGAWSMLGNGRDGWDLALPSGDLDALSVVANANRSALDLAGARVGRVTLTANASDIVVDAATAAIASLSVVVNTGSFAIQLPADSDVTASLRLTGGRLRVCAPVGLGLRMTLGGLPRQVSVDGIDQRGNAWQSANYGSATHRADLDINAKLGAVDINPIGGCR